MRSTRRVLGLLVALPLALPLALTVAAPTSAATPSAKPATKPATSSTWTLYDGSAQHACFAPGDAFSYFVAEVVGTWSRTVQVRMSGLPEGSIGYGADLPPGENEPRPDGSIVVNAFVAFDARTAPVGVYHPEIYATDGVERQSFQVTLEISEHC